MKYTYYDLLGIGKDADKEEISAACMQNMHIWATVNIWLPIELHAEVSNLKDRCLEAIATIFSADKRRKYDEALSHSSNSDHTLLDENIKAQWLLLKTVYQQSMLIHDLQANLYPAQDRTAYSQAACQLISNEQSADTAYDGHQFFSSPM